jgi:hypothetical protein
MRSWLSGTTRVLGVPDAITDAGKFDAGGVYAAVAALAPPGADSYGFVDVDSTSERVYGYQKSGAEYGYIRVRGLHPLLATVLMPIAAPVIVGTRLRRGSAGSAKGSGFRGRGYHLR